MFRHLAMFVQGSAVWDGSHSSFHLLSDICQKLASLVSSVYIFATVFFSTHVWRLVPFVGCPHCLDFDITFWTFLAHFQLN